VKLLGGSFPCDCHADKLTIGVLACVGPFFVSCVWVNCCLLCALDKVQFEGMYLVSCKF